MDKYKIIRKGILQSLKSFQEELNSWHAQGWRVVGSGSDTNQIYIILERDR